MEFQLSIFQQQKLLITQDIKQSIEILQMSSLELMEYLKEQMADNPLIDWISAEPRIKANRKTTDNNSDWWLNIHIESETLEEVLLDQLKDLGLDKRTYRDCLIVIRSLNEKGYLEDPLDLLSEQTGAPLQQLERALRVVQGMQPQGVGATSLEECLLLK